MEAFLRMAENPPLEAVGEVMFIVTEENGG
jgi:hypothetical protein